MRGVYYKWNFQNYLIPKKVFCVAVAKRLIVERKILGPVKTENL